MSKLENPLAADAPAPHDLDELVHEDRVHRSSIPTPASSSDEMTHVFGAVPGCTSRTRARFRATTTSSPSGSVCGRSSCCATVAARFARSTTAARIAAPRSAARSAARRRPSSARITAGPTSTPASCSGVPWPDGYACDFKDAKFNLAQVPRVESYRGFIFGTLNPDAPPLLEHLGPATQPIDEWLDRHPGGRVAVRRGEPAQVQGQLEARLRQLGRRLSRRVLAPVAARDGKPHAKDADKGMSFYMGKPDEAPMYVQCFGHGHHFKDKRPNIEKRPGALWEIEAPIPGDGALPKQKLRANARRQGADGRSISWPPSR